MPVGFHNIFPLKESDEYSCHVFTYELGHSGLYIGVSHRTRPTETAFYLYFTDVRYFQCPVSWSGLGFEMLEDAQEHLNILTELRCFKAYPKDFLLRATKVYLIDTPHLDVKIVAGEVEQTQLLPQHL